MSLTEKANIIEERKEGMSPQCYLKNQQFVLLKKNERFTVHALIRMLKSSKKFEFPLLEEKLYYRFLKERYENFPVSARIMLKQKRHCHYQNN